MAVTLIIIMMILLNNNKYNNDFNLYFLNYYFFNPFVIRLIFFQFYHLIFYLLGIRICNFSKLDELSLITRITNLKNYIYIFKAL